MADTTGQGRRNHLRIAIHLWIREDLGLAAKMTITPRQVEGLLNRLEDYLRLTPNTTS